MARSMGCMKAEVDLFSVKPIQDAITSSYFAEFRPFSSGMEDFIEFVIPETPEYIDLSLTKLHLKVRILDPDGKVVENKEIADASGGGTTLVGTHVKPCNNFMGSLFNQVMVFLNHRCISPSGGNYHYRSHLENLLNYGYDAKTTHLITSLYLDDEVITTGDPDKISDSGFSDRSLRMVNGNIELMGYLNTDLSKLDKTMLNNMHVRIKLYRNKPSFSLLASETIAAGKDYKIEIKDAVLLVRKVIVNDHLVRYNESLLKTNNAKYNINRVEMKTYIIPRNTTAHVIDNLFASQLPKRIFVMAIEETSEFNYAKNPYRFKNFDLRMARLSGDSLTHLRPIRLNATNMEFMEAYSSFMDASNVYYGNFGNNITSLDYLFNNFILGFDLSPDMQSSSKHISIPRTGVLRLELHYGTTLTQNIKLIIYAEFDSLLEITSSREAIIDYSA